MNDETLPEGWRVWNEEPEGRIILAYRPDIFTGEAFDPACLPTIYVTNGSPRRRPGAGSVQTDTWRVILYAEPEIELETDAFDSRTAAIDGARSIAERFATGAIDYRAAYQVPREAYFDRLDELTGCEET